MDINERKKIVQCGRRLVEKGLTFGSGGNVSIRLGEEDRFLITPSGLGGEEIKERDLVVMNTDGEILKGDRRPSSEWCMHSKIYQNRPDIGALVHTHSPYVTVVSTLGKDLPAISYLTASAGVSSIPLAPYATFGTEELADSVAESMGTKSKAVMLANHGLIAGGKTLADAFSLSEEIEFSAFLYVTALSTHREISYLSEEQMQRVIERLDDYGQRIK